MRLLIIEDEPWVSDAVADALGEFSADRSYNGEEGLYMARGNIYDLIVLDLMLPLIDGYKVLEALRREKINTPVLVLTAKDSMEDKFKGFRQGADDYLVKPFHREELRLRVQAILRRTGGYDQEDLTCGVIALHPASRTASIEGRQVELLGKQYDILEYLVRNQNAIVTKEQIFDRIWGFDSRTTANVVEVYASNLRKTLKPYGCDKYIKTVRGMGYMLTDRIYDNA